jgi:hypothetical protein
VDVSLIEVHHLAMIPVSRENDIFALRDRVRVRFHEIDAISPPSVNFLDGSGRDSLGGPWRKVDIVTVTPWVD